MNVLLLDPPCPVMLLISSYIHDQSRIDLGLKTMLSTEGQRLEAVYLLVAIAAVVTLSCRLRLLRPKIDTREPPLVSPRIPIFGHALGLLRFGVPYYTKAT